MVPQQFWQFVTQIATQQDSPRRVLPGEGIDLARKDRVILTEKASRLCYVRLETASPHGKCMALQLRINSLCLHVGFHTIDPIFAAPAGLLVAADR